MSIAKSSFIFSAGTLLSRVSGVLRESVVAAVFGVSALTDSFAIAYRIPNLLRELLAEGALGSSFTKVYSSLCVENQEAASKLLIQTLQFVVMISFAICAIGGFFASDLVHLMTQNDPQNTNVQIHNATVVLTQILFPFIGFASIGAIVQGALFQRGGFFLAGVSPILFNLFSIVGAIWLAPLSDRFMPDAIKNIFLGHAGIIGLAIGTVIGGAAQSALQTWGIWKPLLKGRRLWPSTFPWSDDFKKVLVLMTPMVIAASAGQINAVVNANFATSLGAGAVTWINFAFRLIQLPIGLFGVAVGAAVLPALSKSIAEAKGKMNVKSSREIINAMDLVAWLMIPCTLVMCLSSVDITRVLFQAGRFNELDTKNTALAIAAYSYGLLGYGLLKVLNSYYYATGRTKFPMIVSLVSIAGNYTANAFLVKRFGHEGLAVTASIMLTFNSLLLMLGMTRDGVSIDWRQMGSSISLLLLGMSITIGLHHVYSGYVEAWSVSHFFNLSDHIIFKKLDALFRTGIDTCLVLSVFGGMGLARIKKNPREALKMLRRRR